MPQLFRKPGGVNVFLDHYTGNEIETHSSTCNHCQHLTEFPSRKVMMDYVDLCFKCMKLVCREPECQRQGCIPYDKRAEMAETEEKIRSRIHMQAWKCY